MQLQKVVQLINELELDGVILMSDMNRYWFTEFASSAGYVFVNKEGKTALLIDARYFLSAKEFAKNIDNFYLLDQSKTFVDHVTGILNSLSMKKVGLESEYTTLTVANTFKQLPNFEAVAFNSIPLRTVKEKWEIEYLQRAADISAETIEWAKKEIRPGMTELEIATMISIHQMELGAECDSFPPIVASGINGANPHHHPSMKVVENGDMITLDIGCKYKGYCSDITRSFILGGEPSNPELFEIYKTVYNAQTAGIKAAKAGVSGADVDLVCRDIIGATKYKDYFTHSTGHGVGIEVHELPNVTGRNKNPLVPNNVVTVEPGIYVPNVGGVRIEDTILITDGEPIVLTRKATK